MRRAKYILYVLYMLHAVTLSGQSRGELRDMFISAEGDLLFEDYAEALPKYLNLLQIFPENYNFYFRIGQCYLNTPGEKTKSIPFLETAAKNINPGHRPDRFRETGAPYDVLYHLANAYRINNQLDKALETYALFLRDVDTEVYDTALVSFQIASCHTAREMMRDPVYVIEKNLGQSLNDRFSEFNPVVSDDTKTILFTRELQFYDAVFYASAENGQWTEPVNLTPQLGIDQDYYTSSLAHDGKTLLLYRTDKYDGNIYLSRFDGGKWSTVEKLNDNINTKYWESNATLSRDGKRLYFTSNRRESIGGLDIFVSASDSTGKWGPALNLGPVINTIYNEESPFLANNDSTLFFSSRGHKNMGGYDIFRSDLDRNGIWSTPVNLGYPVNTTDDDLFFFPAGSGDSGYFSKFADDGYGRMDMFLYEIYSARNPRYFTVSGTALIKGLLAEFPQPVKVTAVNNADSESVVSYIARPETGGYVFSLPQGSYTLSFASEEVSPFTLIVEMPLSYKGDSVTVDPVTLTPDDTEAFLEVFADTTARVNASDPLPFTLMLEEKSLLKIDVISSDTLRHTERHRITDTTFAFLMVPPRGESLFIFSLSDRFGNQTRDTVAVSNHDFIAAASPARLGYRPVIHDEAAVMAAEPAVTTEAVEQPAGSEIPAGDESLSTGDADGRCSPLWWLLLLLAAFILYLILRSKKRKKNDNA
jgi:hypothetical protein